MRYIKFLLIVSIWSILISTFPFAQEITPPSDIQKDAESLGIVLDLERPSNTDILLLRNGDKLTGTVLNETFSIRTSYAEIVLSNRIIAGIDLEGGTNNIEKIITVNNNRFSGFIDDSVFVFKLQSGDQIEVRREKVLKVVFRVREAERRGIPQRQFITLKNGDYFSGNILNEKLIIATTYAKVPLNLKDAESVTLIGAETPLTKVMMLNGDLLQGVLETEDIEIELDLGSTVKIYQDRIDVIYCQQGAMPGKSENPKTTFALRDTGPAGGVIFYDKGNYSDGWQYLEAAPASTEWTERTWGSNGTFIGGTKEDIGTGKSNTTIIVAWLNRQGEAGKAAQVCDALVVENNGVKYSDWFLPSKVELNLMYENLCRENVGSFADYYYWSSSEGDAESAWLQNFDNSLQYDYDKYSNVRVRAVRAF